MTPLTPSTSAPSILCESDQIEIRFEKLFIRNSVLKLDARRFAWGCRGKIMKNRERGGKLTVMVQFPIKFLSESIASVWCVSVPLKIAGFLLKMVLFRCFSLRFACFCRWIVWKLITKHHEFIISIEKWEKTYLNHFQFDFAPLLSVFAIFCHSVVGWLLVSGFLEK